MGTGITNQASPTHEYTAADFAVSIRSVKGIFPISAGGGTESTLEDGMYGDKAESKTIHGAGSNPRAHTRTINKPTCELSLPIDVLQSLRKHLGRDGICDVIFMRQAPGGKPITDVIRNWKPVFAYETTLKSGDASIPKLAGNALRIDRDVKGVIL